MYCKVYKHREKIFPIPSTKHYKCILYYLITLLSVRKCIVFSFNVRTIGPLFRRYVLLETVYRGKHVHVAKSAG